MREGKGEGGRGKGGSESCVVLTRSVCALPGISLKICVVDVTTKTSKEPVVMRAESGWIVGALKKEIAEVRLKEGVGEYGLGRRALHPI